MSSNSCRVDKHLHRLLLRVNLSRLSGHSAVGSWWYMQVHGTCLIFLLLRSLPSIIVVCSSSFQIPRKKCWHQYEIDFFSHVFSLLTVIRNLTHLNSTCLKIPNLRPLLTGLWSVSVRYLFPPIMTAITGSPCNFTIVKGASSSQVCSFVVKTIIACAAHPFGNCLLIGVVGAIKTIEGWKVGERDLRQRYSERRMNRTHRRDNCLSRECWSHDSTL